MEKLYTAKEVAELTGYKLSTILQYRKIGQIEAEKYGRAWRFTKEQIQAFLDMKKKGASNE